MQQLFFSMGLFLSATLLFIIQPMAAKILLPVYGGTPAVWSVCMLFFQLLLLMAYAYAWGLSHFAGGRYWRWIHLLVCGFSLLMLPLSLKSISTEGAPEWSILRDLVTQLGLPLLVVGASAPLLQYAFSQTENKRAADPYFLYVASNVGSLLTLLSYPWLVERFVGVAQQFYVWNGIYVLYLVLLIGLLLGIRYRPSLAITSPSIPVVWRDVGRWIFLSFVPCSLMLGVTFYISTDVAATPLLWVVPLALYLLSFVVTFAQRPLISHAFVVRNALIFFIFPILGFIIGENRIAVQFLIPLNLAAFFIFALLCHGELVRSRPLPVQLTLFYFCLALGGVLAGIFNGLIAPRLFLRAYEYPIGLLLAVLCLPWAGTLKKHQRWTRMLPLVVFCILLLGDVVIAPHSGHPSWVLSATAIIALLVIVLGATRIFDLFLSFLCLFIFIVLPWNKPFHILNQQRNFYGVKQVFSDKGTHALMSHSTLHGFQVFLDKRPPDGTQAYYASVAPVVQLLQAWHQPLHAMVIGLGTGMLACQFHEEDKLTVVEIDEQMINIAKNPVFFTYLRDCSPHLFLLKSDGRLAVTEAKDASYELLIMDAFSSDAIPIHLLTLEAMALYKQKVTQDGAIVVNVTNRHLRVLPVLAGAGRALDMIVLQKEQKANLGLGQFPAEWALLTTNETLAARLMGEFGWHFVADAKTQLWTDDYSNLIPLLKW